MADWVVECPGLYCGRTVEEGGSLSWCGACPAGSRVNSSWVCKECLETPSTYDWMYLVMMACVPLLFNTVFIDISVKKQAHHYLIFHGSALFETAISFVLALLLFPPIGSLQLVSCGSQRLSDWYTLFFNPTPDFVNTLHCTHEAVHPLYSIVFINHLFNLLLTITLRCLLSRCLHHPCPCSLYASLFLHPPLALIHATLAGIIYYTFPYIILLITMVTNAVHLASFREKTPRGILKELVSSLRNMSILLLHTSLLLFAVFSLLQCRSFRHEFALFTIVPLPAIFYIVTAPFTEPHLLVSKTHKHR